MNLLTSLFTWLFPAPAPVFTPGQTVRLVRCPPDLVSYRKQMPLTGTVQPYTERDIRMGTVPVLFSLSPLIRHIAPEDLEAVLTEI